ncbi:MAG: methylated-DNA--[protein]-cysteine S-methyltransferase, partial [candidate division NC10 bacterium]
MDRVDEMLAAHFSVEPAPAELASRIVRRAHDAEREVGRLLDEIEIAATDRGVCLVRAERLAPPPTAKARRLVEKARVELGEYLEGKRTFFTVPVDLSATPPFQREVLAAARSIPFGEVRAYAWVAERIRHPRAVRAVGTALGRNPVPLIVPCHRVLRSDGGVGGYLFGTRVKDRLLALERSTPVLEGCATTRIVCRVGCVHGRHMSPSNRVVFASVADARSVGYRPCKVCRPAAAA